MAKKKVPKKHKKNSEKSRKHAKVPSWLREIIKLKYNYHCQSCLDQFQSKVLQVHHIKPYWRGGNNNPENLCPLCANCHIVLHSEKRTKNVYNCDNVLIYDIES